MPLVYVLGSVTNQGDALTIGLSSSLEKAKERIQGIETALSLHTIIELFTIESYWLDGAPTEKDLLTSAITQHTYAATWIYHVKDDYWVQENKENESASL